MEVVQGPAHDRWTEMRTKAGFDSDTALLKAVGSSRDQLWNWVIRGREPNLYTLLELKRHLGVSLDAIAETIVSMRAEVHQNRPVGGGQPEHGIPPDSKARSAGLTA